MMTAQRHSAIAFFDAANDGYVEKPSDLSGASVAVTR